MGTAAVQGELWGARAQDWADLNEPAWRPVFEAALKLAGVAPGKRLIDIGCGAGGALVAARQFGAEVAGLDASANLVAIARERLPHARVEIGEMEDLPFDNETFDIATGINSSPNTRPTLPLAEPGTIEDLMGKAGLKPMDSGEIASALTFRDVDAAVRVVLAASARAIRHAGEQAVADTIRATLPPFTQSDGSVLWNNRFRWVRAVRD